MTYRLSRRDHAPLAASHRARTARGPGARPLRVPAATAVLLLTASIGAAAQQSAEELTRAADASRSRGVEDAPVVVYEVADFQCPYCGRFSREVFPKVDSAYIQTGKVRWIFINYPVASHPRAWAAAEAALCAGAVGDAFWAMHDHLFERQEEWSRTEDLSAAIEGYARDLELPRDRFQSCTRTDILAQMIARDLQATSSANIRGTPTFFINQQRSVVGLRSFEEWEDILDEALANSQG